MAIFKFSVVAIFAILVVFGDIAFTLQINKLSPFDRQLVLLMASIFTLMAGFGLGAVWSAYSQSLADFFRK